MALIGEDFDYTFTEGERPIFRIRGDEHPRRPRGDHLPRPGRAHALRRAGRALPRREPRGELQPAHQRGAAAGQRRAQGARRAELRTPVLQLRDKGKLLVSTQPVRIRYGDRFAATAERLRVHRPQELFVLQGGVSVHSLPGAETPLALTADRLLYERSAACSRPKARPCFDRGGDHLEAQRVNAFLDQDESGARLRARGLGRHRTARDTPRRRRGGERALRRRRPGAHHGARRHGGEARGARRP